MRRLFRILLPFLVFVLAFGGIASANEPSPADAGVREFLNAAFDARYRFLVHEDEGPAQLFYEPNARHLASKEIKKLREHYLNPAKQAGFKYTDVEIYLDFASVEVDKDRAAVKLFEEGRLTYVWPSGESAVTKYFNIEHQISLVHKKGQWYVTDDKYMDLFTVPDRTPKAKGSLPDQNSAMSLGLPDGPLGFYVNYNRNGAVSYATTYCNSRNPKYKYFTGTGSSGNCANFVSQSMHEGGGAPTDYGGYDSYIWWYNWNGTYTNPSDDTWVSFWTVAHDLAYYLARNTSDGPGGSYVTSATELGLGDVIVYDFPDAQNPDGDGYFDHSAIVIGFSNGQPLVAYNTSDTCSAHWNLGAKLTKFIKLRNSFFIS